MGVGQGDTMLEERPSPECRLLEDLDSNAFSVRSAALPQDHPMSIDLSEYIDGVRAVYVAACAARWGHGTLFGKQPVSRWRLWNQFVK